MDQVHCVQLILIRQMYKLQSTGGIHAEEEGVHKELKDLLLPSPLGVCITTEAAQQLSARLKAGHVVGTGGESESGPGGQSQTPFCD